MTERSDYLGYVACIRTLEFALALGWGSTQAVALAAGQRAIDDGSVDLLEVVLQGGGMVAQQMAPVAAGWGPGVAYPQMVEVTDGVAQLVGPQELWTQLWGVFPGLDWTVRYMRGTALGVSGWKAQSDKLSLITGPRGMCFSIFGPHGILSVTSAHPITLLELVENVQPVGLELFVLAKAAQDAVRCVGRDCVDPDDCKEHGCAVARHYSKPTSDGERHDAEASDE